ncbi:hypothetical protein GJ496_008279 [Pomphorhynchus laevis]|nr:hypothetical protein GJ496_008279 [Pomphorhynchus laevis]
MIVIIGCYFNPAFTACDIIDELTQFESILESSKHIFIGGYFNARYEQPIQSKLECLIDYFSVYVIRLHPTDTTYVCNSGSSAIKLVFSNLSNVSVCISHSSWGLLRNHKPVEMSFHLLDFPKYPNAQKVLSYIRFIDA